MPADGTMSQNEDIDKAKIKINGLRTNNCGYYIYKI